MNKTQVKENQKTMNKSSPENQKTMNKSSPENQTKYQGAYRVPLYTRGDCGEPIGD
jgi:hypothetical protein